MNHSYLQIPLLFLTIGDFSTLLFLKQRSNSIGTKIYLSYAPSSAQWTVTVSVHTCMKKIKLINRLLVSVSILAYMIHLPLLKLFVKLISGTCKNQGDINFKHKRLGFFPYCITNNVTFVILLFISALNVLFLSVSLFTHKRAHRHSSILFPSQQ